VSLETFALFVRRFGPLRLSFYRACALVSPDTCAALPFTRFAASRDAVEDELRQLLFSASRLAATADRAHGKTSAKVAPDDADAAALLQRGQIGLLRYSGQQPGMFAWTALAAAPAGGAVFGAAAPASVRSLLIGNFGSTGYAFSQGGTGAQNEAVGALYPTVAHLIESESGCAASAALLPTDSLARWAEIFMRWWRPYDLRTGASPASLVAAAAATHVKAVAVGHESVAVPGAAPGPHASAGPNGQPGSGAAFESIGEKKTSCCIVC
jgi:hypothetical protein